MSAIDSSASGDASPLGGDASSQTDGARSGRSAAAHAPLAAAQLVGEIARLAADKKAIDVVELDLRGVVGYTDYFLICSGNTGRQVKAIHDAILEGLKREHDMLPRRVEGSAQAGWILMDYLDVVVHIFTPQTREFYRLEQLWGEAPTRAADTSARAGEEGERAADAGGAADVGDEPSEFSEKGLTGRATSG